MVREYRRERERGYHEDNGEDGRLGLQAGGKEGRRNARCDNDRGSEENMSRPVRDREGLQARPTHDE